MKRCSSCETHKPYEDFTKNKSKLDGYHNQCKDCRKEYTIKNEVGKKAWADPVKKARYQENHKRWQSKNKDYYNSYMRGWNRENKDYSDPIILEYASKRRALKVAAIPKWVDKTHRENMRRIYKFAKYLTNITGTKHEVDHIEPITHSNLCGMHVWWNLAILTQVQNRSKGNKLSETITSPRVSETCNFEEYFNQQVKMYADLYQIQDIELWDKKPVG